MLAQGDLFHTQNHWKILPLHLWFLTGLSGLGKTYMIEAILNLCIFWPSVNTHSGFTVNTFWNFPESLFTPSGIAVHTARMICKTTQKNLS